MQKTIAELKFIISNSHTFSNEEVATAMLDLKRHDWKQANTNTVKEIDTFIRKHDWMDFHVSYYDGYKLKINGSIDFSYYHNLEITFENVFFVSAFFNGWHSDTQNVVFQIPDNEVELNRLYEIEEDYQVFVFQAEDYSNNVIVAAEYISFNSDTVHYNNAK